LTMGRTVCERMDGDTVLMVAWFSCICKRLFIHILLTQVADFAFLNKECICKLEQCGWFYMTVKHKQYCCPMSFYFL